MRQAWAHSPPIGGTATQGFAGEALPGIGDTESTVDEDLQRQGEIPFLELSLNSVDVFDGTFPRQHHQLAAKFLSKGDPGGTGHRHLGRSVDGKVGGEMANQPANAHILHNHRIHPGKQSWF